MRILDRYIIRHFLSTFFLMVALFCVVAVVFDVAENLERLIDNDAPWGLVFGEYYLSFCLALGNMLSAFIVFLTILLFTSRLAQRSEIIAVLAGGISFQRLMRPYLLASTLLVIGSLVLAHFILPASNQRKLDFEVEYIHKEFHIAEQHLYRELAPGTIVYMRSINAGRQVGYRFVLEQWEGDRLREKWMASKARWIEEGQPWRVGIEGSHCPREGEGVRRGETASARASHPHVQCLCHLCHDPDRGQCGQPETTRGDRHSPPHRRGHWLRVRLQCQADLRVGDPCRRSARGRRLDARRLVRPARHCPVSKGPQVRRSPPGFQRINRGTAPSNSASPEAARP